MVTSMEALAGATSTDESVQAVDAFASVVIESAEPTAWLRLGADVLGAVAEATAGGVILRFGHSKFLEVRAGTPGALVAVGWYVAESAVFDRIAERAAAYAERTGTDAPHKHMSGARPVLTMTDPDGVRLELTTGSATRPADIGAELGHLVMGTGELDRAVDFYTNVLGLRVTDRVRIPFASGGETVGVFLRAADRRHHCLALIAAPPGVRHVMIELADLDSVGAAYDRCEAAGSVSRTLGRHTNDHMLSFYLHAPDPIEIEIGCGGILIDDSRWTVQTHERPSVWGHRFVTRTRGAAT
jgi:2,3-dihydroxybiphenyl 1,2-dioxygenase